LSEFGFVRRRERERREERERGERREERGERVRTMRLAGFIRHESTKRHDAIDLGQILPIRHELLHDT